MPVQKRLKIRVRGGVQVDRPVAEVFSFLRDVDRFPEWQSTNFEIAEKRELGNGALRAHGSVRDRRNVLGKEIESVYQVTDLQEDRSMTLEVKEGPVYWIMTFSVEEVEGATYVTADGGGDLGDLGVSKAATAKSCQEMLENDLHTLRDVLESVSR